MQIGIVSLYSKFIQRLPKEFSDGLWGVLIAIIMASTELDRSRLGEGYRVEARQEIRHIQAGHRELIFKPLIIASSPQSKNSLFVRNNMDFPQGSERVIALN